MATDAAFLDPASLSVDNLNLTADEVSTYPRWYTDLLLRKRSQSITMGDIIAYVANFGLSQQNKSIICSLFPSLPTSVDPPIFYACLRLVSHAQSGQIPSYSLMFQQASVPKPKSIVSKTKKMDPVEESPAKLQSQPTGGSSNPFRRNTISSPESSSEKPKFDIDSFTSFMMTGNAPKPEAISLGFTPAKSRHNKHVMFDPSPPQVAEAAPRSMEELLRQARSMSRLIPTNTPPGVSLPGAITGNYNVGGAFKNDGSYDPSAQMQRAPLVAQDTGDVEIDSHFKNINIDTVLHNGVSNLPDQPAVNKPSFPFNLGSESSTSSPQNTGPQQNPPPLPPKQPSGTGNAYSGMSYQSVNSFPSLQPTNTGPMQALKPNMTGPVPKLQPTNTGSLQSLPPTNTGSVPPINLIPPPPPPQPRKDSTFLSPQPTGPLQSQSTGSLNHQQMGQLGAQATGPSLNLHPTSQLGTQATGGSLNHRQMGQLSAQATGSSLNIPSSGQLGSQVTGGSLNHQQMGQLGSQATGNSLNLQSSGPPTLQAQSTGSTNYSQRGRSQSFNSSLFPTQPQQQQMVSSASSNNLFQGLQSQSTGNQNNTQSWNSNGPTNSMNLLASQTTGAPQSLSDFKSIFHPPASTSASSTAPVAATSFSNSSVFNPQPQQSNNSFSLYLNNNLNPPNTNGGFNNGSNTSLASQQSLQPQSTGYTVPAPPPARRIFNGVESPSPIGNSPSPIPNGLMGQQNIISTTNGYNNFNSINNANNTNNTSNVGNLNNINSMNNTNSINNSFQRPQQTGQESNVPVVSNGLLMPPPPPTSRRRVASGSGESINGPATNTLVANPTGSFGYNTYGQTQNTGLHPSASQPNLTLANQQTGFQPQQTQMQQFQQGFGGMASMQRLPPMNGVGNIQQMGTGQGYPNYQNPQMQQQQQQQQQQHTQSPMYNNFPASNSVPNLVSGLQGMRIDGGMNNIPMNTNMNGMGNMGMNSAFGNGYMMNGNPNNQAFGPNR